MCGSSYSLQLSGIFWVLLLFAQPLSADNQINFQTAPGFGNLRDCAYTAIVENPNSPENLSCPNAACLCVTSWSSALQAITAAVGGQCSEPSDGLDISAVIFTVSRLCTANGITPSLTITETPPTGNLQHLTLGQAPGINSLPNCAIEVLAANGDLLGCNTNDCFCRPDLLDEALTSVSSLVVSACTQTQNQAADVASATSCYLSYCLQNGYSVVGTNTISTTGTAGALVTVNPTGKTTPSRSTLSVSSPTSSSNGSTTSSSSNLSSGGKSGIAIGVLALITAIITAIKWPAIAKLITAHRKKQKEKKAGGVVTVVEHPDKMEAGHAGHAADSEAGNGGPTMTVAG